MRFKMVGRRWLMSAAVGCALFQQACIVGYRPGAYQQGFWDQLGRLTAELPAAAIELLIAQALDAA